MMKGIDISNWQANIIPSNLNIDFCICKATEGLDFVDKFCDAFIQNCKSAGILYGFYHFARSGKPADEARFFYENCKGYIGEGIPVLDYEVWGVNDDVAWCEDFLKEFLHLSGIWPLLYISASHCRDFTNSWIPQTCGLWVAGYPTEDAYHAYKDEYGRIEGFYKGQKQKESFADIPEMPYDIYPWEFAAIWQFTSSLVLPGYNGSLDGDLAYMDAQAWAKYARSSTQTAPAANEKKKVVLTIDGKKYAGWVREK